MPGYVAIATTAVASIHERILPLPALVLAGIFPPLQPHFPLFLVPFSLAAKAVKRVGVLLQVLFLLQGILFEALGDGLNSFVSSSPSISTSHSSLTPMSSMLRPITSSVTLLESRQNLSRLTDTIYPTSLSTLWGNHFNPLSLTTDPTYPLFDLTQRDLDEYEQSGVQLKRDVETGIEQSVDLWFDLLYSRDRDVLVAVREELERIQQGRPTLHLYSSEPEFQQQDQEEESFERELERADHEYELERDAKLDTEFETFLDRMKMDDQARTTLDHPSDPKDPKSLTFRQLLRQNWQEMYGSGSVLGNLNDAMVGIEEIDLGMGRPIEPGESSIEERLSSRDYKPGRLPLMLNHFLRDQLDKTIASSARGGSSGLAKYLDDEDPIDLQILPKLSRKVSDDYLTFFQRAVKVDVQARQIVIDVLSYLSPSSTSSSSSSSRSKEESRTSSSSRVLLLSKNRGGHENSQGRPLFSAFIKKLDWTLTRCSERFLSQHEFARAAFGPETGYLAVKWLRDEIERYERSINSSSESESGEGDGTTHGERKRVVGEF